MILDVNPGSGFFSHSGSRGPKRTGLSRIRNTGKMRGLSFFFYVFKRKLATRPRILATSLNDVFVKKYIEVQYSVRTTNCLFSGMLGHQRQFI
jgi:hypothetical protein